ncbi:MAG: pyruvate dehydrogenase E2 component (dihydrolipoamide acetyltransferase) [Rhodocyclaceae bacterium]|nr:MAG: pyruvate dehydrogenase E2 component (dihydrolipoamide acetyltransferase) [Rhodocyclaceae bacterium]TND00836.1 MAG: pyruvate dehydrogenase E2 component (dihydrolipoamide acetyltransferase) [Rhodocyclaceae bacterium]
MIEFKLPALGSDMDEGTLLEWKVGAGDTVKKGQVVAIVDTTKAAVDVESWQEGTVHQLIAEIGQKMPVGTVMALLLAAGETAPAKVGAGGTAMPAPTAAPAIAVAAPVAAPAPAPAAAPAAPGRRMISPAARKHAEEKGVDLDGITGTGPHGAVTLEDVENAAAAPRPAPAVEKPAGKTAEQQAARAADMRKTIAAAMSRSKREIPHYYVSEDIPLARALAWLQAANAQRPMAERLLPAALLLKAVAMTLKRYPELNGYWRDGGFVPVAAINLGVAISLRQGGLIAPALLNADSKPLTLLMQELTDLVKRTRAGSLRSSEMNEATITVTNLGDQGSNSVFGVITPPQVALVGFGRVAERPWAEAGGLKVLPVVTASLSADHRVSDGHRGALFLLELNELLQHPEDLEK